MSKKVTYYFCDICNARYSSEEGAKRCQEEDKRLIAEADNYCYSKVDGCEKMYTYHRDHPVPEIKPMCSCKSYWFFSKRGELVPLVKYSTMLPKYCPFCGKPVKKVSDWDFKLVKKHKNRAETL